MSQYLICLNRKSEFQKLIRENSYMGVGMCSVVLRMRMRKGGDESGVWERVVMRAV